VLPEDRFKRTVILANAVLALAMATAVGLLALPSPFAAVVPAVVGAAQFLVLRVQFAVTQEAGQQYDKVLDQVQRQVEGVRNAAIYDATLGLYQRWYLEGRLKQELARCRRYGLSLALIVVRFERKGFDPLSDAAWQAEAVQAAYAVGTSVRNVDLAAMIAEREFAVSLVHCNRKGAEVAMERLSQVLEAHDFKMGLAVFPEDDAEPTRLIELAQGRVGPFDALAGLGPGGQVDPVDGIDVLKTGLSWSA
jgi:GGDEF domain-containing protein